MVISIQELRQLDNERDQAPKSDKRRRFPWEVEEEQPQGILKFVRFLYSD